MINKKIETSFTNSSFIKRQHRGMSLVELLISMVVGLFLLAGVVTNFISTKTADVKRQAVSEMDANANVAFAALRQAISHAGYTTTNNVRLEKAFYTASDGNLTNPTCSNGQARDILTPAYNRSRTRDAGVADRLTVITLADNPCLQGLASCPNPNDMEPTALVYTDCTGGGATRDTRTVSCSTDPEFGMPDPTEAKLFSTFRLIRNVSSVNDRQLRCEGNRGGSQPIVDNVEAIQYLYGVKQDDGRTVYRTANQVENADQWGLVRSVQVGLLIRSSNQLVLDQNSTKTQYSVLNARVRIANRDLRRLFRVYTTTINLENLNKGALL